MSHVILRLLHSSLVTMQASVTANAHETGGSTEIRGSECWQVEPGRGGEVLLASGFEAGFQPRPGGAKSVSQNLACTYRAANSFVSEPKSKMKHPERGSTVTTDRTICQSSQIRFSVGFRKVFVQCTVISSLHTRRDGTQIKVSIW